MKSRVLAVLLALPLVAFDCGGKDEPAEKSPFGLACKLHVGGGVPAEDMWCVMMAYDYSALPDPELASSNWVFEINAYRGTYEPGASAGFFLDGRPALGPTYGWNGDVATSTLLGGGADLYASGTMQHTHSADSLGSGWSGTGQLSVTFTAIPPASAVNEQLLGVHGTLTATLPSLTGGEDATLSATF